MSKMTEAQKRAALKYQKTLGQISIRLPKGELARYKEAASAAGMPFRAWVLCAMAGYLDDEALSSYEQVFHNSDLLTGDERKNIQEQIDLFTKGRKRQ